LLPAAFVVVVFFLLLRRRGHTLPAIAEHFLRQSLDLLMTESINSISDGDTSQIGPFLFSNRTIPSRVSSNQQKKAAEDLKN